MNGVPRNSILSNVKPQDLNLDPFPHLIVENALDAEVFAELEATFPSDQLIVDDRTMQDTWYDYPACKAVTDERISPVWRRFFAHHTSSEFFQELVALAGPQIRALNPRLEERAGKPLTQFAIGMRPGGRGDPLAPGADASMECQFYVNYTKQPRTVRGPHVDRPSELFAALLYFRQPEDDCTGGNLEICEATRHTKQDSVLIDQLPAEISPKNVRTVAAAPYKRNTLVLFLNSPRSIHSVAQRSPTPLTRRHINFCCDVNFDLFTFELPYRLKVKKQLERAPVAWRLAKRL
jgi:hypothetical protein